MTRVVAFWVAMLIINVFIWSRFRKSFPEKRFSFSLMELFVLPFALLPSGLVLARFPPVIGPDWTVTVVNTFAHQFVFVNQLTGLFVGKILLLDGIQRGPVLSAVMLCAASWMFLIVGPALCFSLPFVALIVYFSERGDAKK